MNYLIYSLGIIITWIVSVKIMAWDMRKRENPIYEGDKTTIMIFASAMAVMWPATITFLFGVVVLWKPVLLLKKLGHKLIG